MFGLFQSKSEKLVKKIYKLHRELFSAARNALNKDTDFWWNYVFQTGENIEAIFFQLAEEMGEEYADNILNAVLKEQTLPDNLQLIIANKLEIYGQGKNFAKTILLN